MTWRFSDKKSYRLISICPISLKMKLKGGGLGDSTPHFHPPLLPKEPGAV